MSIFDDYSSATNIKKDADKMILTKYRISNSGNSLIPKKGSFAFSSSERKQYFSRIKLSKLPDGVLREEKSVFMSMYGKLVNTHDKLSDEALNNLYDNFVNVIRSMNIPMIIYNGKRYYQANRDVKHRIFTNIHKSLNDE
jgi:hypothetical protein